MLWNSKFAFGINEIDEQHKELFDLMRKTNELIKEAKEGEDVYDEIAVVLKELEAYTVYHFEKEEELLLKANYGDFEAHQNEHIIFVDKVHETLDSDVDMHQTAVLEEISDYLLEWVSNHILYTDVKYVKLLKGV